jgi:hypothetical protein
MDSLGESGYPELPVGQDSAGDARRKFWEEQMALGPFAGLAAHLALGSVKPTTKSHLCSI